MKGKPVVGQTLYSLNVGDEARGCEQKLTEVTVRKVGRKYFTCVESGYHHGKEYHIDGWREKTNYGIGSVLYESKQAWEDDKESSIICKEIYSSFEYGRNNDNVSLENLRLISGMLGKKQKLKRSGIA